MENDVQILKFLFCLILWIGVTLLTLQPDFLESVTTANEGLHYFTPGISFRSVINIFDAIEATSQNSPSKTTIHIFLVFEKGTRCT